MLLSYAEYAKQQSPRKVREIDYIASLLWNGYRVDPDSPTLVSTSKRIFAAPWVGYYPKRTLKRTSPIITISEDSVQHAQNVAAFFNVAHHYDAFSGAAEESLIRNHGNVDGCIMRANHDLHVIRLEAYARIQGSLLPEARDCFIKDTPEQIVEKFGHFFADKVNLGGHVQVSRWISAKYSDTVSNMRENVGASYNHLLEKFKTKANMKSKTGYSYQDTKDMGGRTESVKLTVRGGSAGQWIPYDASIGDSFSACQRAWELSLHKANDLHVLQMNLVPIWKAIPNPHKAQAVKIYLEELWKSDLKRVKDDVSRRKKVTFQRAAAQNRGANDSKSKNAQEKKIQIHVKTTSLRKSFSPKPSDTDWTVRYSGNVGKLTQLVKQGKVQIPSTGVIIYSKSKGRYYRLYLVGQDLEKAKAKEQEIQDREQDKVDAHELEHREKANANVKKILRKEQEQTIEHAKKLVEELTCYLCLLGSPTAFKSAFGFTLDEYLHNRDVFAATCRQHAEHIEKIIHCKGKAEVVAAAAEITSGALAVVGVLAAPFTFGWSLGVTLTLASGGLGVASAVGSLTTDLISDNKVKADEKAIENAKKKFESQERTVRHFFDAMDGKKKTLLILMNKQPAIFQWIQAIADGVVRIVKAGLKLVKLACEIAYYVGYKTGYNIVYKSYQLGHKGIRAVKLARNTAQLLLDDHQIAEEVMFLRGGRSMLNPEYFGTGLATVFRTGGTAANITGTVMALYSIVDGGLEMNKGFEDMKRSEVADKYREFAGKYEEETRRIQNRIEDGLSVSAARMDGTYVIQMVGKRKEGRPAGPYLHADQVYPKDKCTSGGDGESTRVCVHDQLFGKKSLWRVVHAKNDLYHIQLVGERKKGHFPQIYDSRSPGAYLRAAPKERGDVNSTYVSVHDELHFDVSLFRLLPAEHGYHIQLYGSRNRKQKMHNLANGKAPIHPYLHAREVYDQDHRDAGSTYACINDFEKGDTATWRLLPANVQNTGVPTGFSDAVVSIK